MHCSRIFVLLIKTKLYDTAAKQETAVLVAVQTPEQSDTQTVEYLEELAFLIETCGAKPLKQFTQKLQKVHPRTYVGEGKLADIVSYIKEHEADIVVFDDELTPSQIRNIETEIGEVKILDRSNLILDIFARNARTSQAKTQVELAQNQYMLPRLTRMWTHLQKQKGGVGMRGPGEREIETDRRVIRDRISLLKDKLEDIDRINMGQRKNRTGVKRLALVGYTNVGKSSIMNMVSKSEVLAENKLFATLDATVRKVYIDGHNFLLSDTVGFIRKLPHQLVECFKSTLDEVREADALLHVVDVSHKNFEEQIDVVNQTLVDIGAANKPTVMVFNKIDLIPEPEIFENLQATWMAKKNNPSIFVSVLNRADAARIKEAIVKVLEGLK